MHKLLSIKNLHKLKNDIFTLKTYFFIHFEIKFNKIYQLWNLYALSLLLLKR